MEKLSTWHETTYGLPLSEALPTLPQRQAGVPQSGLGRGFMNLTNRLMGKPEIDWSAVDSRQAQQTQQQMRQNVTQGTKDDPQVQQQKYNILNKLFRNGILNLMTRGLGTKDSKIMLKPRGVKMIQDALSNLAASFTLNKPIRMTDIEQILIAVNQYSAGKSLRFDKLRNHQFANPATVLRMLQDIFNRDKRVWYDPDARNVAEQYPPRSTFNPSELQAAMGQWENSPYKYQPKLPTDTPQDDNNPTGNQPNPSGDPMEPDASWDTPNSNRKMGIGDIMQKTWGHANKKYSFDILWDIAQGIIQKAEEEGHPLIVNAQELNKIHAMAKTPKYRH